MSVLYLYVCSDVIHDFLNIETFCERTEIAAEVRMKMQFFCKEMFHWLIPDFSKVRKVFWVSA